ncbi:MAG: aminotransferase class III-fold pyridoxal phosphate-dependent enzyme, partial [Nitrosomonadales bacterium]|nr:aminotransferase class III-fold pyridoxal phosphate-dependent enzyme [Nitrosomonadales bacterium]
FTYGKHGSTFGGNPLASMAGLTTLETIAQDNLRENAETIGDWMCDRFKAEFAGMSGIEAIRNAGLMIGIQLAKPCGELVKRALEHKLLINVTADNVVRLLPPLVIDQDEAGKIVDILSPLIKNFLNE